MISFGLRTSSIVRLKAEFVYLAVLLDEFPAELWAGRVAPRNHHPPAATRHRASLESAQYASAEYVQLLRHHQIIRSMSRPANPYDNARRESFMKTLKREKIYANTYRDLGHLRRNHRMVSASRRREHRGRNEDKAAGPINRSVLIFVSHRRGSPQVLVLDLC